MANFYFVSSLEGKKAIITEDLHHILKVSRHKLGEKIGILFPPLRGWGKISKIENNCIEVELLSLFEVKEPEVKISIAIPFLTDSAMSEVLKHSVELGVYKIYIYESSFSRKKKYFKKERAMKILKEAAKQSGNPYIPEVLIVNMEKLSSPGIFMHIDGGKIHDYNPYKGENLIIVGPEGDFEVSEVTKLKNKGFYPVKFGNFILRSETAVLSAVSAAKVLWGSFYEEVSILRF